MADESRGSLTADREDLFSAFAADPSDANRNAIAESFLPLAEFFAGRYKNRGADSEDLRQVAKLALVKAVDRFDPSVGVQFSTFAGRTIDGELKRYFRDKTWSVRVPRSLQERSHEIRRIVDDLANQLGTAPTVAEITEASGYEADEVIEALDVQRAYSATSIDSPAGDGDESTALSTRIAVQDPALGQTETALAMRELLSELPAREREILELRFFAEESQAAIAEKVGVSQMHVSRLIRQSLEELRAKLGSAN
jgi:RNA polymerase sigma-B factor